MATDGSVTEFDADLSGDEHLKDVAVGPDGWVYYTVEHDGGMSKGRSAVLHSISRVNPADGDICHFSDGLTGAPNKIISASDGKLYFTISDDPAAIGRIKPPTARSRSSAPASPTTRTPSRWPRAATTTCGSPGAPAPGASGAWRTPATPSPSSPAARPASASRRRRPRRHHARPRRQRVVHRERARRPHRAPVAPPVAELALDQKAPPIGRHTVTDGELNATVTPNSQATSLTVEYGPDTSYGKQSDPVDIDGSSGAGAVTETIPLSLPASSHAFARLVATNEGGTDVSAPIELWTDAEGHLLDFAPEVEVEVDAPEVPDPTHGNSDAGAHQPGHGNDDVVPAADAPVAPPVLGKSVVVHPAGGKVKVKTPGSKRYRALAAGAQLPVGTTVDTRSGKIVLQSARDAHGRTQKGTFWGGVFQIRQRKHGKGMTDLHLRGGGFSSCGNRAGISVLAREAKGKRRVVRRLWGKDRHSRFRTHGRDSVATVRGTRWVTTDRCDGTLTRVTQGKVSVRDLHRKRSVLVSAGHAYLARHRHHHR